MAESRELLIEIEDLAAGYSSVPVVRDLDLELIDEVRAQWAFYRDRRPDMYGPLTDA